MNLAIVFAAFLAIGTTSIPAASAQAQGQQGPLRSRALQTPDGTPPAFESECVDYKDEEEPYGTLALQRCVSFLCPPSAFHLTTAPRPGRIISS